MKRRKVKSSNIKSIGYDIDEKLLEVEFHTGAIYRYDNVPNRTYTNLMNAKSIGTALHKIIRPRFKAECISDKHDNEKPKESNKYKDKTQFDGKIKLHRVVKLGGRRRT